MSKAVAMLVVAVVAVAMHSWYCATEFAAAVVVVALMPQHSHDAITLFHLTRESDVGDV